MFHVSATSYLWEVTKVCGLVCAMFILKNVCRIRHVVLASPSPRSSDILDIFYLRLF